MLPTMPLGQTGWRFAPIGMLRSATALVRTPGGLHARKGGPRRNRACAVTRLGRDFPGETERRSCAVVRALQSCPCRTETPGQRHAAGKGLARAGEGPRADSRCTPEILRTASPAPVVDFSPHLP